MQTSYTGNDQAWFPTPKGDLFLLFGLDPTKNREPLLCLGSTKALGLDADELTLILLLFLLLPVHSDLKRTLSQSQAASPAGVASSSGAGGGKRQRVSPPNALSLPANPLAGSSHPFPSIPSGLNSSAMLQAAQGGQGQTGPADQAQRIQAMQRQLATNPAAIAQQLAASRAGGPGALHPSLQSLSVSPDLQAQYAALSNVATAQGGVGQPDLGAGNSAQANLLAQQYHRQRLQAQYSSAANGISPVVPSQASLPTVPSQPQPLSNSAAPAGRPNQQPPGRPVWKGELGWNVGGKEVGAVLGCRVLATLATPKIVPEDL